MTLCEVSSVRRWSSNDFGLINRLGHQLPTSSSDDIRSVVWSRKPFPRCNRAALRDTATLKGMNRPVLAIGGEVDAIKAALRKSLGFGRLRDARRFDRFEQIPVGLPGRRAVT
jgi:hypothetical protein